MTDLITSTEVCNILSVSKKTLWVYLNEHKHRKFIKSYKLSHKNVLYCRQSIYEFIAECQSV
ncbi:hypothetical protein SOPP22_16405 [Shewanella sp. OPT22]|nr:hypothetical protein SOPP22_16405 [Shewanella sp. OPT22]